MSTPWSAPARADIAVAGSGIVGLGIALEGLRRGLKVIVIEQDARPSGASVRNFGHGCATAQSGIALDYAIAARERWLMLRNEAGLWVKETGTVVVARSEEELKVLQEFSELRPGKAEILSADEVLARAPISSNGLVGGAFLPFDIRLNPREAAPKLAEYLASKGVEFHFGTSALGAETGVLHTSRGDVHAPVVVLALGHDVDRMLPCIASDAGVTRCTLHMLRIAAPSTPLTPALLTGTSLLRYSGFVECPSSAALREQIESERPELVRWGVNHMITEHPSGDLLIGDTHTYDHTPSPFADEELDQLLIDETRKLFGVNELTIKERWRGVYASAPDREYLSASPTPGVTAIAVTSGIGMTTALGFAPAVLDEISSTQLAGSAQQQH